MSKKVLFLSYRLGYDALLYWDNILSSIQKEFNNFRVFTAWEPLTTKNKLVTTEEKLKGIKYYHNKNKLNQKLYYIPLPFFIFDIMKDKPDLIILNEFNIVSFYSLFFRFLYKNTKFLLLVESDPGLGNITHKKNTIRHIYRKFIVKNVDLILTNNQLGMKYVKDYLEAPLNKIKEAAYLTSFPDTDSKDIKNNDGIIHFLYVGQLIERKGLICFFESLNTLPENIKNTISIDIIGGGDLESKLKEYTKKNKLDYVNFRGKLPFSELSMYYKNADCFVLPTLHDYRALVGFEAISFGCAIIDSIYDGARFEVVEENKNGYIVDPKNIKQFSDAIIKIVVDKERRQKFQEYSLKKSDKFTHQQCNENLIKTINEALYVI